MKARRYDYAGQIEDWPALLARIEDVLRSGRYVLGAEVGAFEEELADYLGAERTLGVNCGTDALLLAYRACGLGPGDRAITQANTFHATVSAMRTLGVEPVLVDAHPETFVLDAAALEEVPLDSVRAVVPVHLYGRPCDMDAIAGYAKRNALEVVEDAAQAIGARWRGRRVGTFGRFGAISFHPSKNLAAAGDGGAIVLRDGGDAPVLEALRALGQVGQNDHHHVGINSKLDTIQAVVLSDKLARLDTWNADRRRVAASYRERLSGLPLRFQDDPEELEHVYHLFYVRAERRDGLLEFLREHGVDAVVRYPTPIHLQPAFDDGPWKVGQFPVAEALAREGIALPIRPGMGEEEIEHTVACIREFYGGGGAG